MVACAVVCRKISDHRDRGIKRYDVFPLAQVKLVVIRIKERRKTPNQSTIVSNVTLTRKIITQLFRIIPVLCVLLLIISLTANVYNFRTELHESLIRYENSHHHGNFDSKPERSLVILMGNLRGGEKAWQTLYENVLEPNNADLALIIGKDSHLELYPNCSLLERAKYLWTFDEHEDWADAIDLINGTGWRKSHLPLFIKLNHTDGNNFMGGVTGFSGSGAIIFMARWFLSRSLIDFGILDRYDRFVITRSDHFYQCVHRFNDFDVRNRTMWIPPGEDNGGFTDRHLVIGRANVLDALDIFPTVLGLPPDYFGSTSYNPEGILKAVWGRKGLHVKYFERVMFTVATGDDTTRWTERGAEVPGFADLFLKYEQEYYVSQYNCFKEKIRTR